MIEYIKRLFGITTEEKTAQEPEQPKVIYQGAELEERIQAIHRSCCSRHGARDFFSDQNTDDPQRTIELYWLLEPKLHSYCSSTQSIHTSSNAGVIRTVFEAAQLMIERDQYTEEMITLSERILGNETEFYLQRKDVEKRVGLIKNLASQGRYSQASILTGQISRYGSLYLESLEEIQRICIPDKGAYR